MVSFAFAGGRSFLEASRGSDSELNVVVVVDDLVRREAQRRTSRVEGGISLGRKELFRSFLRRRKWD